MKTEEMALGRKEQLELRKLKTEKNEDGFIKLPEEFVRELDLIKMKHGGKEKKTCLSGAKITIDFYTSDTGTRKILYKLGLSRIFSAVFAKVNESILEKLQRGEPYVTYGIGQS